MTRYSLRRAWSCAVSLAIVLAFCACFLLSLSVRSAAAARNASVVVFPFENVSHAGDTDWLGDGLSELTTERLTGHGLTVFSREERLDALEKLGLPAYAQFSRATMLKIAAEIDADYVIFGEFSVETNQLHVTAHILRVSPPRLSEAITESGALDSLAQLDAQFAWQALCRIEGSLVDASPCDASSGTRDQFLGSTPRVRLDAFEYYVRGLVSTDDDSRLRDLREAGRLQPDWDLPVLELGRTYYARRDCDPALQAFGQIANSGSHAAEVNFDSGVCDLLRNDPVRAEAAFTAIRTGAGAPADQPEVISNLGAALLRQARYKEAIADFEQALKADPGEPDYEFNDGLGKYLTADWEGAAQSLREALRLQPDDTQAKGLLIGALTQAGETDEANALRGQAAADANSSANANPNPMKDPIPFRRDISKLDPTSLARLARVRPSLAVASGVVR